jgi:L-cysteate sulfo-lyase
MEGVGVPYGASDSLGALGYVLAAAEIAAACPTVKWVVHASGSAGTQAGLLAGFLALGLPTRVIGVDVDAQPERVRADVCRLGRAVANRLGIGERWADDLVEVADRWNAAAYGLPDAGTEEAIRLAARFEGLALDPVYAGKGMAALIGLARSARFRGDDSVVWLHTGGTPAIFAYQLTMDRASSPLP